MAVQVYKTGFLNGERTPRPKPSPDDFKWPATKTVDKAARLAFQTRLIEELRKRGMDHRDLAISAAGTVRAKNGSIMPRAPAVARAWVFGKSFPNATMAAGLAGYFKISMADLLKPRGPLEPMERLPKGRQTGKANGKANGHDHGAAAHSGNGVHREPEEAPPPLQLPEGASPPIVELKSYPGDSRFMAVSIGGVLPVDQALALVAMIHPRHG